MNKKAILHPNFQKNRVEYKKRQRQPAQERERVLLDSPLAPVEDRYAAERAARKPQRLSPLYS